MTAGTTAEPGANVGRLLERAGLWPIRALWVVAPLIAGRAVTDLLDGRRDAGADGAAVAVEVLLWAGWFAGFIASLVPSPVSLTAIRLTSSTALAGCVLLLVAEPGAPALGALLWALVTTSVAFLPVVGDVMINGSAYGSERRMALRPPAYVLLGPAQVSWLCVTGGFLGTAALVLAERWVLAAIVGLLGAVLGWAGFRILHQLAKRWIVFVPAGFVIRDPMHLVDAVLLRRQQVAAVGPALATESGRTDLSGGARGLAIEVEVKEPTPVTIRVSNEATNLEVTNLVFTPTLPGAMLREARIRGLKIGTAPGQG
ncbi:MAG: hypothetical protein AAGA93_05205 [Actinomycetota bacterium]